MQCNWWDFDTHDSQRLHCLCPEELCVAVRKNLAVVFGQYLDHSQMKGGMRSEVVGCCCFI